MSKYITEVCKEQSRRHVRARATRRASHLIPRFISFFSYSESTSGRVITGVPRPSCDLIHECYSLQSVLSYQPTRFALLTHTTLKPSRTANLELRVSFINLDYYSLLDMVEVVFSPKMFSLKLGALSEGAGGVSTSKKI